MTPTDSSVGRIANTPGANNNNNTTKGAKKKPPPKTLNERLSVLEMTTTRVQPGMLALTSMRSRAPDHQELYMQLDKTVIYVLSCMIMLGLRWFLAWERVLRNPCCDNMDCWYRWMDQRQEAVPLLSILALLAFDAVYKLGRMVTKIPDSVMFQFSPVAYMTSLLVFVSTFALSHVPHFLEETLGIPLLASFEEVSARLLLWLRLLTNKTLHENSVAHLARFGHVAIAMAAGWLVFCLVEPMVMTIKHLMYFSFAGQNNLTIATNDSFNNKNKKKIRGGVGGLVETEWQKRLGRVWNTFLLLGVAILPPTFLATYIWHTSTPTIQLPSRGFLAWCFVGCLCLLSKPILESYLQQGLSAILPLLQKVRPPVAADLKHPFTIRIHQLLRTGSALAVFPCLIIILLFLGHLTTTLPTTTRFVHPQAYRNENVLHIKDIPVYKERIELWKNISVVELMQQQYHQNTITADGSNNTTTTTTRTTASLMMMSTKLASLLSPTSYQTCGIVLPLPSSSALQEELAKNGAQLYEQTPVPPMSLAQLLMKSKSSSSSSKQEDEKEQEASDQGSRRSDSNDDDDESDDKNGNKLQKAIRKLRKPSTTTTTTTTTTEKEDDDNNNNSSSSLWICIFFPNLFTSTIILPILDFFGLLLATMWTFLFYSLLMKKGKAMRDMAKLPFRIMMQQEQELSNNKTNKTTTTTTMTGSSSKKTK